MDGSEIIPLSTWKDDSLKIAIDFPVFARKVRNKFKKHAEYYDELNPLYDCDLGINKFKKRYYKNYDHKKILDFITWLESRSDHDTGLFDRFYRRGTEKVKVKGRVFFEQKKNQESVMRVRNITANTDMPILMIQESFKTYLYNKIQHGDLSYHEKLQFSSAHESIVELMKEDIDSEFDRKKFIDGWIGNIMKDIDKFEDEICDKKKVE